MAALAAAPLVGGKIEGSDSWRLIKPSTRLYVAVDPGGQFSRDKSGATRDKIIQEIVDVLRAQGVDDASDADIQELVKIRTRSAQCYEYAHFTDEELTDGIITIHDTINGMTRRDLVSRISSERARLKDIKKVWTQWKHKPSKVQLAAVLWPALRDRIQRCKTDEAAAVPEIAEVVSDAYLIANRWRYHPSC